MNLEQKLLKLNQIGIALSSERDPKKLLSKILTEARLFTYAEAGSLYIREGEYLKFTVSQNQVTGRDKTQQRVKIMPDTLPMTQDSIAGYVGMTGTILNIPDVYTIPPTTAYKFNRTYDRQNNYVTKSMLVVPMKDTEQQTIGVLALINAHSSETEAIIPFDSQYESLIMSLASQAAVAIKNIELTKKLKEAYLDTLIRLSVAAECKEQDIAGHLQRISIYSGILAEDLGLSAEEVDNIRYASPMHDIGKIGIPDSILKKSDRLTPEEYEIIKQHTIFGSKILNHGASEIIRLSEQIALTHHERYDGTGYPYGLKGDAIPLAGRIVALADVFDALMSKRYYKEAWETDKVIEYIHAHSGTHFDPQVVQAFDNRLSDFLQVQQQQLAAATGSYAALPNQTL